MSDDIRKAFEDMVSQLHFSPSPHHEEKRVIYCDGQWMTPSEFAAHHLHQQYPPEALHCPHCNAPLYLYYPEMLGDPEFRQYDCGTLVGADTYQSYTCRMIESGEWSPIEYVTYNGIPIRYDPRLGDDEVRIEP